MSLDSAIGLHGHECLIYDGAPSEQLPIVIPLLVDGLRTNWRCLYLGDPASLKMIEAALVEQGIDPRRESKRGALVLSSDRSHLTGRPFDPAWMMGELGQSVDRAVADGYEGLCATGDMRWELGDDESFDRLLEYEARLEQFIAENPLRGICQYRRDDLPEAAIRDALLTHRGAHIGDVFAGDNFFYLPPELLLEGSGAEAEAQQGAWMCQQILRMATAGHAKNAALAEHQRSTMQLGAMNRELERRLADRTAELELANRHLDAISRSLSHDLRAQLRDLRDFEGAFAEEQPSPVEHGDGARRLLEKVRRSTLGMEVLLDGLLAVRRRATTLAVHPGVRCTICGHTELREIEYKAGGVRAPALECRRCRAINLDERAGSSDEGRESIRQAMAVRQAATYVDAAAAETQSRPISASRIDVTISEIDALLARALVGLEFLVHATPDAQSQARARIARAQQVIQRMAVVADELGRECADSTTREPAAKGGAA
jgi:hypothetical protein